MSDEAKKPEEAPKPKSSKLLPIFVGLNSLLLIGVMAVLVLQLRKQAHAAPPPEAAAEKHEGPTEDDGEGAEPPVAKAESKETKEEKKEEKKEKDKEGEGHPPGKGAVAGLGPLVKLADFVIHLRNPEIDRYARMSFDVEVFAESDRESLNANMPRVRDAFISYLSDRTLEELQGAEGLSRTKDALQSKLRDLIPEARVRRLYISDFVVQ
jgi:flagellar FliL protein